MLLAVLALLTFFFPLLTIKMPIVGEKHVTGYAVVRDVFEFQKQVTPGELETTAEDTDVTTTYPQESQPSVDAPLSVNLAWLIPLGIIGAYLCAVGVTLASKVSTQAAFKFASVGAVLAGIAVIHISVLNSDFHSSMTAEMSRSAADLKDNPFAELAQNLSTMVINAFAIQAGTALYALALLLAIIALAAYTRLFARLRLDG